MAIELAHDNDAAPQQAPARTAADAPADLSNALRRAFRLGQTYWQLADSEYTSHHRRAEATHAKFEELVASAVAALATIPDAPTRPSDERIAELWNETAHGNPMKHVWKFADALLADSRTIPDAPAAPKAFRDEVAALMMTASTAMHQDAKDQRNILEDIAERLSAMLAAPAAPSVGDPTPVFANGQWNGRPISEFPEIQAAIRQQLADGTLNVGGAGEQAAPLVASDQIAQLATAPEWADVQGDTPEDDTPEDAADEELSCWDNDGAEAT